jgi:hypothetical protein
LPPMQHQTQPHRMQHQFHRVQSLTNTSYCVRLMQ